MTDDDFPADLFERQDINDRQLIALVGHYFQLLGKRTNLSAQADPLYMVWARKAA